VRFVHSDLIDPTPTLVCTRCDRRGVYGIARLMAKNGDARLNDLRSFLTADFHVRLLPLIGFRRPTPFLDGAGTNRVGRR
jgi:hypothetical protein